MKKATIYPPMHIREAIEFCKKERHGILLTPQQYYKYGYMINNNVPHERKRRVGRDNGIILYCHGFNPPSAFNNNRFGYHHTTLKESKIQIEVKK